MTISDYEKEFRIFSANINQAARSFYYHIEIDKQVYEDGIKYQGIPNGHFQDSKLYQAIQSNSQFWNDYKQSSIVYAVITLGRILDKNKSAHKVERLVKIARGSKLFTNKSLKERKIKGSDNATEWIDSYMKNTYELSEDDFSEIERFVQKTQIKWDKVKDLRHKIYAHQEIMDDNKRTEIFNKAEYAIFDDIISSLLTVENLFFQAFYNGGKPDYTYINTRVKEIAAQDVRNLLEKLS